MKIDYAMFIILLIFCIIVLAGSYGSPLMVPACACTAIVIAGAYLSWKSRFGGFYVLGLGLPLVFIVYQSSLIITGLTIILLIVLLLRGTGLLHHERDIIPALACGGISLVILYEGSSLLHTGPALVVIMILISITLMGLFVLGHRIQRYTGASD